MSKHTPGPWTAFEWDGGGFQIETNNRFTICSRNIAPSARSEESLANARLIAAAPDLLEALNAALERIPNEHDFDHTPSDDAVREQARAAIAKAEGKS